MSCPKCLHPLTSEGIFADQKWYHPECFECFNCKKLISNKFFFMRKKAILCSKCYQSMYSQRCTRCLKQIKGHGIKAADTFWHPRCLRCFKCKEVMFEQFYVTSENKFICEKDYEKGMELMKRLNAAAASVVITPTSSAGGSMPNISTTTPSVR